MADGTRSEVAREIGEMLAEAGGRLRATCCIYKVPDRLRKLNEDAYTPKVVSIGPLHHGSPSLRNKEREKQIFVKKFIERSHTGLGDLVTFVEKHEPLVRDCYSENIKLSKEELVKIIFVDACFILELIIWFYLRDWNGDDILSLNSWLFQVVLRDLLLLENQLPFFLLDELYRQAMEDGSSSLLRLAFQMFSSFDMACIRPESVADSPIHFTDLLRTCYLRPGSRRSHDRVERKEELLYSVTKLREAGVKLRANETIQLLDLNFLDGVLEIPILRVDEETEMLFGNMIALEQCHYPFDLHIAGYVYVLSCLIKTNEDVDIAAENRIINVNYLGHSNVTRLFYSLAKNIQLEGFGSPYSQLCRDLNEFRKNARIVAALRRDYYLDFKRTYCKTPLQALATFGGILLLVLTVIQTVCSIKQVA